VTKKRTSTSTTSISVWKICELKQYFRKLNIKCCRRLLKLQNIYSIFFLNMFRFLNKLSLFGVGDVTKLLATWHSTTAQPRKCFCSWLKSSKSTSNVTNYYIQPPDDDKTKFFLSALFRVSRKPVFRKKVFGVQSCWKFYHICSSCPRAYSEVFRFVSHLVHEIFTNYFLIN